MNTDMKQKIHLNGCYELSVTPNCACVASSRERGRAYDLAMTQSEQVVLFIPVGGTKQHTHTKSTEQKPTLSLRAATQSAEEKVHMSRRTQVKNNNRSQKYTQIHTGLIHTAPYDKVPGCSTREAAW